MSLCQQHTSFITQIENSLAITSAETIQQICKPLFNRTAISYFSYIREYNDKSRIWLCTDPEWTKYLYQREYAKELNFKFKDSAILSNIYTWTMLAESLATNKQKKTYYNKLSDAKNFFNIDNGFTIAEIYDDYREYYSFGVCSASRVSAIDAYLFDGQLFENFIYLFKEKALSLIKQAENKRIIPIGSYINKKKFCNFTINMTDDNPSFNKASILFQPIWTAEKNDGISVKRYYLSGKYRDIYFTKRQFESVKMLSQGLRLKTISTMLNISVRTIESYIKEAKEKLSCNTTTELIQEFKKYSGIVSSH